MWVNRGSLEYWRSTGCPGHQAGVRLRLRSRDRQASVADRGTPCSICDSARRKSVAHTAVSDEAPGLRWQGITEDDLIDFTPELRAEALAIARTYVLGPLFTPGSLPEPGPDGKQGTIQMPGRVGGADWTGAAFDPETDRLYVPSMTGPIAQNVMPGNPESSNLRYRVSNNTRIVGPPRLAAGETSRRPDYSPRSESW